jgi:uncharacterized phage protein (TIGR01671 family)
MNYQPIVSDGTDGGETSRVMLNEAIECFEYTLMQFTGLLDKNGKDIYEGDIIISKFTGKAKHEICYGEYAEDYENPDATKVGFYTIEDGIEIQGFGKDINGTTDSYEVIGNIYENK